MTAEELFHKLAAGESDEVFSFNLARNGYVYEEMVKDLNEHIEALKKGFLHNFFSGFFGTSTQRLKLTAHLLGIEVQTLRQIIHYTNITVAKEKTPEKILDRIQELFDQEFSEWNLTIGRFGKLRSIYEFSVLWAAIVLANAQAKATK